MSEIRSENIAAEFTKLAVCITFHYTEERIQYLSLVCKGLIGIAPVVDLTIVTNATEPAQLLKLEAVVDQDKITLSFLQPKALGHPFMLTWSHLYDFRKRIQDPSYSHFLYLEDDLLITKENIDYWLEARKQLAPFKLIPGFIRRELKKQDGQWYSTDVMTKMSLYDCPVVATENGSSFIGIVYPYQGLYFYDRELMTEHLSGPSSNPDFEHRMGNNSFNRVSYGTREKASLGVIFSAIPAGFRSRNVLPFNPTTMKIDSAAMIHHLPDNYANNPDSPIAKIRVDELFIPKSISTYFKNRQKKLIGSLIKKIF